MVYAFRLLLKIKQYIRNRTIRGGPGGSILSKTENTLSNIGLFPNRNPLRPFHKISIFILANPERL